ncbi:hypothetical protein CPC08DRAFT_434498 [Agrocybe pediades]|nr:hypothetical protein CPC08DRAFT_434498 [Agrocybe pediades]
MHSSLPVADLHSAIPSTSRTRAPPSISFGFADWRPIPMVTSPSLSYQFHIFELPIHRAPPLIGMCSSFPAPHRPYPFLLPYIWLFDGCWDRLHH